MKISLILLVVIFLNSCNPRVFNLYENDLNKTVSVYYLGKLHNVIKINENSLLFKDSSLVSIKFFGVTNHKIEFNTKNISNQDFTINLRNIFDKYKRDNGISINIQENHYNIFQKNELIKHGTLIDDNLYFYFENDGKYLKIKINCDDIFIENINILATEYLIIENKSRSSFEISGLNWENLQLSKKNK